MTQTPFAKLAQLTEQLAQTTKRLELTALVAGFLRDLAPEEAAPAVRMTIGQVFPELHGRELNVSWRLVANVVDELTQASATQRERWAADAVDGGEYVALLLEHARREPPLPEPLTILDVYSTFEQIAGAVGPGSRGRKETLVRSLLMRASAVEAKCLAKVIYQEMRHGVSEGVMLDAIARAADVPLAQVRRANQFLGDLGELAWLALTEGEAGLHRADIQLFRPVRPMLCQTAERLEEAYERYGDDLALEYKLDGARVQIHRDGDTVRIFSRNLGEVTASLPDVVAGVRAGLTARQAILDGEATAVDASGRPLPFQHLMRRFQRKHGVADAAEDIPVRLYLFDLLYVNGRSLVDTDARERWQRLESTAGSLPLVRRLVPHSLEEGRLFAEQARTDGHEGLVAKDLGSTYTPGVRGRSWLKLKHTDTLDLVIVAADWGYGRRHGWLSNYHLAALDEETGQYLLVGKTFKGLTDVEFETMTDRLLALERARERGTVYVRPDVVVEVLFNEIQESSQYPSGLALRFARIARVRDDKTSAEADTVQAVRLLYERQAARKGRRGT